MEAMVAMVAMEVMVAIAELRPSTAHRSPLPMQSIAEPARTTRAPPKVAKCR